MPGNDRDEATRPDLTFTSDARDKILEVIQAKGLAGHGALRIAVKGMGMSGPEYGMALVDSSSRTDQDVELNGGGIAVLVDAGSAQYVRGARVDYYDNLLQKGFQIDPPPAEPILPMAGPAGPGGTREWDDPLAQRVQEVIDTMINPGVASHGGFVQLLDVRERTAYVRMGGGCQGCGMASVTLKQGVSKLVKQHVPEIEEIIDSTDHAGGSNPYYQPAKGAPDPTGASPFYQPTK
ncbi:MAG: NifU family protein [Chloroflexi bacterium]|nr:NifU family protein [Chloroflexota bacterium]